MSEFKNKSITTKGLELLSKSLTGEKIEFTKIEMGSGICEGAIQEKETLTTPTQLLAITKLSQKGGQATLSASLRPEDIKSPFNWTEIGVYAKGEDGAEILYMYGHTENSSYISKNSLNEKLIHVTVMVSSTSNITATIDNSLVYLTLDELEEHEADEKAHRDIRTKLIGIEEQITNIDLSSVTNHVTTQHTTTKQLISTERATVVSNITSARDNIKSHVTSAVSNITAGDISGKKVLFELASVNVTGGNTYSLIKSYTNSKGGIVRLKPYNNGVGNVIIVVDGVILVQDVNIELLAGSASSSAYSNTFVDIPFSNSFSIQAKYHSSTTNTVNLSMSLMYYLNK